MKRLMVGFLGVLLAASLCLGQAAAPDASATIGHGAFPVKVTKTLDSSKLKDGDVIELETAGSFKLPNGMLISKGSKMSGHVVSAKARSKGDPESQLTLAFDKLSVGGGESLALKGTVQAVFPPAEEPTGPNMATAGTSQGGSMGGGGGVGGGLTGVSPGGIGITNAKNGSETQSSSTPQIAIDPKSTGVQGMHDLQLENGVLTSKGKNVKLGTGVRILANVEISK